MAYIVPSDIKKLEFNSCNSYELETLSCLQKQLCDDYTIFHGVHWSREYESWTHFGEIDFVILHKNGKVLFIEQKNGVLDEENGSLVKHYGRHSKDVVNQIHRSIDKVREKFTRTFGQGERFIVDYLIYCPDYRLKAIHAAGIDVNRVVDASRKEHLTDIIQSLLDGNGGLDVNYQKIEAFFLQTFELTPDIHAHKEKLDKSFVRQSGALVNVLVNLEMQPFRLKITGTAGSGKSLVVQHFMEKQAEQGKRILFLCFNRLLADKRKAIWQQQTNDNSVIQTFYGFCSDFLESQGMRLDYQRMFEEPTLFWQEVLEQVMALDIENDWLFDTLVIDEGQDFCEDWYEISKLFLKDNADILWLEDPQQRLNSGQPVTLDQFVGYHCNINYRSSEKIARFILNTLPVQFEIGNLLPGLGVDVHPYSDEKKQPKIVSNIVQDLIQQGFAQEEICIVSCKGATKSVFNQEEKIANLPLCRFTGRYDDNGQQITTSGKLRFESIHRFKGLESPAIILVDVDFETELNSYQQNLLFCGMTRATVKLDVVFNSRQVGSSGLFA